MKLIRKIRCQARSKSSPFRLQDNNLSAGFRAIGPRAYSSKEWDSPCVSFGSGQSNSYTGNDRGYGFSLTLYRNGMYTRSSSTK